MNKQKWVILFAAVLLMSGGAGLLARLRTHQSLGPPGVKTSPLPGTVRVQVHLPERVLDYQSNGVEPDAVTTNTLPPDTSFGQRHYEASDGFQLNLSVVLMGTDRTSLHKPQFCLTGNGWRIDQAASSETTVHLEQPVSYDLQVVKLIASPEAKANDQRPAVRAVYVYWFVADDAVSASLTGFERMWMMASKLVRTGILQRWAYVSCLAYSPPGKEEATFERIKRFIAAAVPQFQLIPAPGAPFQKPKSEIRPPAPAEPRGENPKQIENTRPPRGSPTGSARVQPVLPNLARIRAVEPPPSVGRKPARPVLGAVWSCKGIAPRSGFC